MPTIAITLLAPDIPMLFMGEEWGSRQPFPFFCDFKGDLAEAVRKGRRQEYGWAYAKYGNDVPDPLSEATFQSAILDWNSCNESGRERLAFVRKLLAVRRREIVPRLAEASFGNANATGNGMLTADWHFGGGTTLTLTANLSDRQAAGEPDKTAGTPIWGGLPGEIIKPWSVFWRLETR